MIKIKLKCHILPDSVLKFYTSDFKLDFLYKIHFFNMLYMHKVFVKCIYTQTCCWV